MRDDKVREAGSERAATARVDVHPAADKAARGMVTALAAEFDRWMADEIEELAESITAAAGAHDSPETVTHLHHLAEQLARQADMLGYADVANAARRLSAAFGTGGVNGNTSDIDAQISELRALIKH